MDRLIEDNKKTRINNFFLNVEYMRWPKTGSSHEGGGGDGEREGGL